MKALINFKICDNSEECGGIAICPSQAMHFDQYQRKIVVDEDKCTNCGICVNACPVDAILVAKNENQYQEYIKTIEEDKRTIKDLFVDRYGAMPLSQFFIIDSEHLSLKINSHDLVFIEVYNNDSIQCLLRSIPISEIAKQIKKDFLYYRLIPDAEIIKQYKINKFPSLLIFRKNNPLGIISGYFDEGKKQIFIDKINKIIN